MSDAAPPSVSDNRKKPKKNENTTLKKGVIKKATSEDSTPASMAIPVSTLPPLMTHSAVSHIAEMIEVDKENPKLQQNDRTLGGSINPTEGSIVVDSTNSEPVSRQPFGKSPTVNSFDFKRNQDLFVELLRSPQNSQMGTNVTAKLLALITQVASTQDTTAGETARNLNFELDAVAANSELVVVDGKDEFLDFEQSLQEWDLNNVICPANEWLRMEHGPACEHVLPPKCTLSSIRKVL